jgi:hypothetical protein
MSKQQGLRKGRLRATPLAADYDNTIRPKEAISPPVRASSISSMRRSPRRPAPRVVPARPFRPTAILIRALQVQRPIREIGRCCDSNHFLRAGTRPCAWNNVRCRCGIGIARPIAPLGPPSRPQALRVLWSGWSRSENRCSGPRPPASGPAGRVADGNRPMMGWWRFP